MYQRKQITSRFHNLFPSSDTAVDDFPSFGSQSPLLPLPRKFAKTAKLEEQRLNHAGQKRMRSSIILSLIAVLLIIIFASRDNVILLHGNVSTGAQSTSSTQYFSNTNSEDESPVLQIGGSGKSGAVLDTSVPFIHIVNSRFQQHDKNLSALGAARLELFETFCLPSMVHQTIQPNSADISVSLSEPQQYRFIWIIKVDPKLDLKLRNNMVKQLQPYPNFFLVGSNNNFGASFGGGSWRGGKAGNDVLYGNATDTFGSKVNIENQTLGAKIYTGEVSLFLLAHTQRDEKIIIETRLDADDGLPRDFLEKIQKSAIEHLSSESLSGHYEENGDVSMNSLLIDEKSRWMFWCMPHSFNWHPTVSVNGCNSELSLLNDDPGQVTGGLGKVQNAFCLTPGLTSGISVGVRSSEVPRYSHYRIMKEFLKHKNKPENLCGIEKKNKHCIQVLDEVYAIRARTPTSDGIKGVKVTADRGGHIVKQNESTIEWNNILEIFGIRRERAVLTNYHIAQNLVPILKDNLAGQCSHLKGKFCRASRNTVEKMIDEAVKARENCLLENIMNRTVHQLF